MNHTAPPWLPGGQAQTIWPALFSRRCDGPPPRFQRERWTTPDEDFIDVDWLPIDTRGSGLGQPLLVMFHGLEGSSQSHYAQAFADQARQRGWACAVPHFRGCSGEPNRAPRAYHSGDYEEIGWILHRFRAWQDQRGGGPLLVVGVSLGGNALMRWAAEAGDTAAQVATAAAAVCAPLDLAAGGHAIGRGFNRLVYNRMFLNSMKPKTLAKLAQYPGLFSRDAMLAARDLYAFDNVFTGPVHGFRDAEDYWRRASAKPHLRRIRLPALVLNACNDPFVPAASLPQPADVSPQVTLWQPAHGGHVGFAQGRWPGHVWAMPKAVTGWLAQHLGTPGRNTSPATPETQHG